MKRSNKQILLIIALLLLIFSSIIFLAFLLPLNGTLHERANDISNSGNDYNHESNINSDIDHSHESNLGADNAYDNKSHIDSDSNHDYSSTLSEDTNQTSDYNLDANSGNTPNIDSGTSLNQDSDTALNTNSNASNQINPDRITYKDGFYYEPLSDDLKKRITGKSYKENDSITYDDLRYLNVLYKDYDGQTQIGEIICNKLIAQDLLEIFAQLYDNDYQIDKIKLIDEYDADDDKSCEDDNTSCFNYRTVAGKSTLSRHALGLAIDINPLYNPYITYSDGNTNFVPAMGSAYADRESGQAHMILKDDLCYTLFTQHGFIWGGEWKSVKDYQHFEKK